MSIVMRSDSIPPARKNGSNAGLPWDGMQINDYFIYEGNTATCRSLVYAKNLRSQKKYVARKVEEQMRVYRSE